MISRIRLVLFGLTGLCVPLFAFPPLRLAGKPVDLATLFAAAFVASSLPAVLRRRHARGAAAFCLGAGTVPLLSLLPPRPAYFSVAAFATSYAHWLLVAGFFAAALALPLSEGDGKRLVRWNIGAAVVVAAFGLYQAFGIPRHWPGTGVRLLPFQQEDFRFMPLGPRYVRPSSLFLEPSWLGGYLCWCLALALSAWALASGRRRTAWAAAALLFVSAAGATVSLGTIADLLVLAVTFGFVAARAGRLSSRMLARAAAAVCALLLVAALSSWGRSLGGALMLRYRNLLATPQALREKNPALPDSAWMRFRNLELTIEEIRSRPFTGVGLGQFVNYLPPERRHPAVSTDPWCGWFAIAAEMGILGPALLVGALLLVLARARAGAPGEIARLAVPALVAIAAVQQLHTASFIDLWWWYPVALAGVLAAAEREVKPSAVSSVRQESGEVVDGQTRVEV